MRVTLLFNDEESLGHGEPDDAVAVRAVREVVDAVAAACRALGWSPRRVAFDGAAPARADVVFNLVEGALEPVAAAVLEEAGAAFTGAPSWALELARDKPRARDALSEAGVPVPRGCVLESGGDSLDVRYPAIVKPAREDASHGIGPESLVRDEPAARERARYVIARYRQPALIEEFLPGAEYGVSLLEGEVLPLAETLSPASGVVTYAAKWLAGSDDYRTARVVPRGDVPEVAAVARAAWAALGVRDYGRVDVRLSAAGEPHVIDVNPNPDLATGAGLVLAAARAGLSHVDLVGRIVEGALARAAAPVSR